MVPIDQISRLLHDIRSDSDLSIPFSFVEVCCTNATILAFDDSQSHPRYVVRTGPKSALIGCWENLVALNKLLPERTPLAVLLTQVSETQWVMVQNGVPGIPWFSVSRKIRSKKSATKIVDQSLDVLREFHGAVNSRKRWQSKLAVVDAFENILGQIRRAGIAFSVSMEDRIAVSKDSLGEIGTLSCHYQHGDFSFNNLIFDSESTFLIDFDDFGSCNFPLLDQVSLAYSIAEHVPDHSFWKIFPRAVAQSQYHDFSRELLESLVVCHLMHALAGTIGIQRRVRRQAHLLNILDRVPAELN